MSEKLKEHYTDEKTGMNYTLHGDYYLPDVEAPDPPVIGRYGRLHLKYLRENKKAVYTGLLLSGKLNSYVEELNQSAQTRFDQIVRQMAKQQDVTEKLKATDQMKWIRLMNNIRSCADEVVLKELIYT